MLCVFDCESVPDVELLREIYNYSGSDIEVCNKALGVDDNVGYSTFLPLPFHKIISISCLICDDFGRFIKIGNYALDSKDEKKILSEFLKYLNNKNPKLISFNGRSFDLPLIMLRAMKYNLNASAYFEQDNIKFNKNKWDNYRTRYSENFHIDLLDSLGSFGMAKNMKLDVLCKMLKIPGKFDVSGDDVFRLYYEEKYHIIDEYCQSDVLNTYWLFLKYQLLQGKICIDEYMELLNIFLDKIPKDKNYSNVFIASLKESLERLN
ncbi:3'-5' exonuclease [Helicobacter sp. MIT 14-3879]|uniref:3'-5' exonuclease n=1 Tax=Helicobacter sp. MIT 14-3879 TaxID=2040649 RepID=UPI000E1EB35A|nr:3'-5' exonuclease [Helicobacter sp. MIT 14-3879]RDU62857.1 3'-5' exonuclease [Helicobacter sp. MIT 14-3879]